MQDPYVNMNSIFMDTSMLRTITRKNNNIFHIFAMHPKYLEKIMENITLNVDDPKAKSLPILIMERNSDGQNAFDIVVN